MSNVEQNVFVLIFILIIVGPFLGGSSCQMNAVRSAHMSAREAFVRTDEFVAVKLEAAGDRCIEQAREQGLTREAGMLSWEECMDIWSRVDRSIAATREAMAELENVYDSIESGQGNENDWKSIARQVVTHTRSIIRLLDELDIGEADDVISSMRDAIDQVCGLVACEGE